MTYAIETIGSSKLSPGSVTVVRTVKLKRSSKKAPKKGSPAWFKANWDRVSTAAQKNTAELIGRQSL